jgi:ATP synthase I chain
MNAQRIARIERWNALLATICVAAAWLFFSERALWGVAVGGAIACLNFWAVRRTVQASLRLQGQKRAALQLLLVLKMGLLMVVIFLVMKYLPVDPAALAVGLSVFVGSIALEGVLSVFGPQPNATPDGEKVDNG